MHDGKIGKLNIARGLCYKKRDSIGPKGTYPIPQGVNYDLGPGRAVKPLTRERLHYDWHWMWDYGNGDLGNQGIHQMDLARWGLGVDTLSTGVLSYGGRLGYEDAGETANTQIIMHDYGDQSLIFEVRGLPTEDLRGAKVGVIFEGADGFVVLTDYTAGAAFDLKGNKVAEFQGIGNHHGNFVSAVRSRKHEDLNADILEGHLSSALCHLGNISYRLGTRVPMKEVEMRLVGNDDALDTFERFGEHLKANGLDPAKTEITYGRELHVDPQAERFVNDSHADAMLSREYRARSSSRPPAGCRGGSSRSRHVTHTRSSTCAASSQSCWAAVAVGASAIARTIGSVLLARTSSHRPGQSSRTPSSRSARGVGRNASPARPARRRSSPARARSSFSRSRNAAIRRPIG